MAGPELTALGVAPDWAQALAPVKGTIDRLGQELSSEQFLPAGPNVLRAFKKPMADVRVLVVGQDPYPTPGHAVGLSFSVEPDVRTIPRSLVNIYKELSDDLGVPPAPHGDLTGWFDQGVLLLNRVLTVAPGRPASHRGRGWEKVTAQAITELLARHQDDGQPMTGILWGRDARDLAPLFRQAGVPFVESPHPSPMSASYGFFGSRPFSRTNALLSQQGAAPIDWRLA